MPAKILWIVLLCFSFAIQAAPKIETWKTRLGVPVYYVHAPELPMLDIKLVFDAGASRDGDLSGLAKMTNALLEQGAGGLDADAISQGFEAFGAIYSAGVGHDSATVQLRSLTDEGLLNQALANLQLLLTKPDFPKNALQRQRARTLVGIKAKQQSAGAVARDAFMRALYQSHHYANPSEGTQQSVNAMTRQDVLSFYKQYYVANNVLLVIVGDVSRKQAESIANQATKSLQKGRKARALPVAKEVSRAAEVVLQHPSAQTHILMGQMGMTHNDPDYFPLYVGNHILGGSGMTSQLFAEIREERGLSYSAYSYFWPMRLKGPFVAGLQTKTQQKDEAKALLIKTINQFIAQGPSATELELAKKNITGGYPLKIDSNSKILNYVVLIAYYQLPLNYLETFNAKIEAVTIEQIKAAFKRRLDPNKLITVIVGETQT